MLYYRQTNKLVHGYTVLKKSRCGHRKILRLTTSLTIYRLGLRGNNAHKSTRKHRFWTRKPLKSPEITQKIYAYAFGTLRSWVRSPSPRPKSVKTVGFSRIFCLSATVAKKSRVSVGSRAQLAICVAKKRPQ